MGIHFESIGGGVSNTRDVTGSLLGPTKISQGRKLLFYSPFLSISFKCSETNLERPMAEFCENSFDLLVRRSVITYYCYLLTFLGFSITIIKEALSPFSLNLSRKSTI